MFRAYSARLGCEINAEDARDMEEVYHCPNRACPARFKLKSVHGERRVHFANVSGLPPHMDGCIYAQETDYADRTDLIKSSLSDILNGTSSAHGIASGKSKHSSGAGPTYVRTPKELLKYCRCNPLSTVYRDGLTVDDIFLCSQNLFKDKRFLGIEGIRLILGSTERVISSSGIIQFSVEKTRANGKPLTLHAKVQTSPEVVEKIDTYLRTTYQNNLSDRYQLAVLANWRISCAYNLSCCVKNASLIMFKNLFDYSTSEI